MANNRNPGQIGFSLIELMIVMAIISILAAVAYPAYTNHVKRGQHSEALVVMVEITAAMEQYALANAGYNVANLADIYDWTSAKHSISTVYDLILNNTAASYSIWAIPNTGGPLADEGPIIIYWDGRKGWDSDNDGNYEVIHF